MAHKMLLSAAVLPLIALAASTMLTESAAQQFASPRNTSLGLEHLQGGTAAAGVGEYRHREGVSFAGEGYIQHTGERLTFVSLDGRERMVLLENLALDRVARTVRDASSKTQWKIHGTITEFQGANYLLLTRVVLVRVDE